MADPCCRIPILDVVPESIAQELGISPGDFLLAVNGQRPRDIIDYRFMEAEEELTLLIESADELIEMVVEKDINEDMGIIFDLDVFSPIRSCENRCIFCFVDQLPKGLRPSLYVKDDDFRYSVLSGNFITLTNLTAEDRERIVQQRLSPLHISLHAADSKIRSAMMGNPKAGQAAEDLQRFAEAGLTMHIQIVLCPGWNDGPVLDQTLQILSGLFPAVSSVGVVPVGLTGYRRGLAELKSVTGPRAQRIIEQIDRWRSCFEKEHGEPLVFAADEFYSLAGRPLPSRDYYEAFPQAENGIGLLRLLMDQWEREKPLLPTTCCPLDVTVVTGVSSARYVQSIVADLNQIEGLSVQLKEVANQFFGGKITVTGLLTGQDLLAALEGKLPGSVVLIPSSMLLDEKDRFLDDMKLDNLEKRLGVTVKVIDALGYGLANTIKDLCKQEG